MRRWVLLTTTALAIATLAPAPARAIFCENCEYEVNAALRQIEQLEQWASQLKAMADQLTQLTNIYGSLTHTTSISGVSAALGGFSRQTLPSSSSLSSLMNGSGATWGTANTRLNEDRLYAPSQSDEWSIEMERREKATSNAKAIAEAAYTDVEQQIQALDALKSEIEAAPDVTSVTAQSGAIQVAHQRLTANQGMVDQARLLLTADDRVTQQRSEQRWRRDVDAWADKTAPALEGW